MPMVNSGRSIATSFRCPISALGARHGKGSAPERSGCAAPPRLDQCPPLLPARSGRAGLSRSSASCCSRSRCARRSRRSRRSSTTSRSTSRCPPAIIGLIGTAPPVCYAVFGILTPLFERRLGLERLTVIAIVVVTVGMVLRGFATRFGRPAARHVADLRGGRRRQHPAAAARAQVLPGSHRPDDDDLLDDDGGRHPSRRRSSRCRWRMPRAGGSRSACGRCSPRSRSIPWIAMLVRAARARRRRRHRGAEPARVRAHVAAAARVGARGRVPRRGHDRVHVLRVAAAAARRHRGRHARRGRRAALALRGDGAAGIPARAAPGRRATTRPARCSASPS